MCGIVGIIGRQEPSWLGAMNASLTHRGPDDFGEYRDDEADVALAMRRLSILDLAGGHQPMSNEGGSVWIVFNGEIYNSPEIRAWLVARGHRFATTNSDTEVLLHLYEEKGEEMLQELNGMFAFVIYDRNRKLLFGARDRVGIKPLYYSKRPGFFAFASELKSLLTLPNTERRVDEQSAFHFMTLLYVPGESSIFAGIKRLPPGHWFKLSLPEQELVIQPYWKLNVHRPEARSENEWCDLIRHQLEEAVSRWMLSDVPVGCSLSGGLDSSTIIGLLSRMGYEGVKTYSLGFAGQDEEEWDELSLARRVAARWGTEHSEIILHPEELLDDLIQMVWHLDEPYGGGLPSWYVFRSMSEDVKVGLTGTGGDELFGNYGKFLDFENSRLQQLSHRHPYLREMGQHLPGWVWSAWRKMLSAAPNDLLAEIKPRLMDMEQVCRSPFGHYYYASQIYFSDRLKRESVFGVASAGLKDTASYLQHLHDEAASSNVRDVIAYVDFQTQLPEEFLLMTDRFSMAHSLEARTPFLDHTLIEMIYRIPPSIRTQGGNLKYLLKRAVGDILPDEIKGARKRGFVIPVKLWLRGRLRPLAERLLSPERLQQQGIFRPAFYHRYVRPHLEGQADHTWQVWAALMFQLWHVVFIEQEARSAPTYTWKELAG